MHICVISPSYPTPKTIVFVFVDQLCRAFADQGVKVTIIAPQSVTRCLVHKEPFAPKHSFITTENGNHIELHRPYILTFGNGKFRKCTVASFNNAIKRTFNKLPTKPDILYGHFWSSIYAAYPLAMANSIPLFGASGEESVAFYDHYTSLQKKQLANYISGLVNVSTKNRNECTLLGLIPIEKTKIIPNAVNLDIFKNRDIAKCKENLGIKPDDFVVSFVGQFVPRKGVLRICDALNKLNDKNIKAIFVGSGIENPQYDGIVFKGRVSHNNIADYLYASDIYVMPTENEGCSNAVIEAMACGLPIVSTDAAFNYDILNDTNSILIDCHNIDQIADAIKKLKDDIILRKQLSLGARNMAMGLSIDERARKILTFIQSRLS